MPDEQAKDRCSQLERVWALVLHVLGNTNGHSSGFATYNPLRWLCADILHADWAAGVSFFDGSVKSNNYLSP